MHQPLMDVVEEFWITSSNFNYFGVFLKCLTSRQTN